MSDERDRQMRALEAAMERHMEAYCAHGTAEPSFKNTVVLIGQGLSVASFLEGYRAGFVAAGGTWLLDPVLQERP